MKLHRKQRWYYLGLIGLDGLFFGLINAAEAPAIMMIIGFALLSISLYYLIYGLVGLSSLYGLSLRKRPLARYLTIIASSLLALQSIGQLSARDIQVLLPLVLLGYGYAAYARNLKRNLGS